MSFGTTPLSTTSLGTNQFPVSAVAVPGESGGNLTALEGGPETTDGNGNKTAPVSVYVKDGGDVTQGTSSDANTVSSVMGRLTKIRDLLSATLTVGGTITEANSASIKSDLDAINTAIGTIADAAWSGSGSGSEIAVLKKIVAELAATLTVSGTVTSNAGSGTFTNQQSNVTADYDTGAGTQNLTMFGVALPASGGAVSGGTATNPIRTDTTGTTTQPVSGTVTVQQATAANLKVDLSGTSANSTAIKTDGSAVTQPVSGTVTANVGTTNGLALDTSVNGVIVAQGSSTSGEKGPLIQGAVTTSAPAYTTAQTSPISLTTTGAVRVDNSANTQPVSGTVTANAGTNLNTSALALETGGNLATLAGAVSSAKVQSNTAQINGTAPSMGNGVSGTGVQRVTLASDSTGQVALASGSNVIGHVIADSGSTTAATQATASNLNAQVVGSVASGAANAGNPVKDGGVFNTTQPTVTNGQVVDAQYSARGAAIVATGVDAFAVNASQSGTWNVTNVSGTVSLPTGASTSAKQPALGTAGSASSDVITVQGITSMTAIKTDGSGVTQPVSGTITANAGTGTFTNQQSNVTADYDSGAGTQNLTMFGVALPASGGAVAGGTSTNPVRTDPTGTTTQPVSGTVSITANSSVNVAQVAGTTTDTNSGNKSAGTQRIVLATDQPQLTNALKVDGSGVTQPVSGTVTANAGSGTFTNQQSNITTDYDTGAGTQTMTMFGLALPASGGSVAGGTSTNPVQVSLANTAANSTAVKVDGSAVTQPVSGTVSITANSAVNVTQFGGNNVVTGTGSSGVGIPRMTVSNDSTVTANQGTANVTPWNENLTQVGGSSVSLGSKTSANSIPVVLASDQAALAVINAEVISTNNSSTTLLAANATFTGIGESSLSYSALSIEVFSDQASVSGGLSVQQSQDNSHWDTTDTFSVQAATNFNVEVNLIGQYFHVVYTNGGVAQVVFRLQTIKQPLEIILPRTLTSLGNLKVAVQEAPTTTSSYSFLRNVAGSTTSVSILAANTARKGALLYNDSSSAMYLAFATAASTSAYTVKIPAGNLYEMPAPPIYVGALSAVWDTATGSARVTELS